MGTQFSTTWRNRAQRGDITPLILQVLKDEPMHGYQIIRTFEELSNGMWRPSAGSVYPILQLLEEQQLVRSHEDEGKKSYFLTQKGRDEAQKGCARLPWKTHTEVATTFDEIRSEIHESIKALKLISTQGSQAHATQAKAAIIELHKKLREIIIDLHT